MISSDKSNLNGVSPELQEIYERAMSHESGPPTVYKCKACKDTGVIDTDTGTARCKCLILQIKMEKYQALMKECYIPGTERFTFDAYKPKNEFQQRAKDAVMAFDRGPKGFYLVGNIGVGKTHLMTALSQHVVNTKELPAIVYSAAVLFDNLLAGTLEDRDVKFREVSRIPLLVIDDIGKERRTEPVRNMIFKLMNERYNSFGKRVTCFTSRYMLAQLMPAHPNGLGYSDDTFDRIRGLADEYIVTGPSGR